MKKETQETIERLEGYVPILRGLINYHKRMMVLGGCPCYGQNPETKEWEHCQTAIGNNRECPKATMLNDVYLGTLQESLRLIEKEIATLKSL